MIVAAPRGTGRARGDGLRHIPISPQASRAMAPDSRTRSTASSPLGSAFFDRSALPVARDLLGCRLRRVLPDGTVRMLRLVEVEAYVRGDPANHAFRRMTSRNQSMFLGPGHLYVYRIHQVHCANLTTRPGEAVLLRAGEPLTAGLENPSGPGRLARELDLTRADDGRPLARPFLTVLPREGPCPRTLRGPRIGISRGTERPLRFLVEGSPWVSAPRSGRKLRGRGQGLEAPPR